MPLSAPTIDRQPRHIRSVRYQSFERSDDLWDVEGELIDTKAMDVPGWAAASSVPVSPFTTCTSA